MRSKNAFLITVFKQIDILCLFIEKHPSHNFYIHVDKKSESKNIFLEHLSKYENVCLVTSIYKVNWGGLNHVRAQIHMLRYALANSDNEFFHTLTESCFPLFPNMEDQIFSQFSKFDGFVESFDLPYEGWNFGGLNRLEVYQFYDYFNAKNQLGNRILMFLEKFQINLGIQRDIGRWNLFGGSSYWSINKRLAVSTLEIYDELRFDSKFRYSFCAEEIIMPTLSRLVSKDFHISNSNLRYVSWDYSRGSVPNELNLNDFIFFDFNQHLFGRKFCLSGVNKLIEWNKNLNSQC